MRVGVYSVPMLIRHLMVWSPFKQAALVKDLTPQFNDNEQGPCHPYVKMLHLQFTYCTPTVLQEA